MAYIISENNCCCESCNGGTPAAPDCFGGSYCNCRCHTLKGQERLDFIKRKKELIKKFKPPIKVNIIKPAQLDTLLQQLMENKNA